MYLSREVNKGAKDGQLLNGIFNEETLFMLARETVYHFYLPPVNRRYCRSSVTYSSWRKTLARENHVIPIKTSELKYRRRRRGRRLVKNEFIFYKQNSRLFRAVRYTNGSKHVFKSNMQRRRSIPNRNTKN